jgi:CheY-like chemotaxis protein
VTSPAPLILVIEDNEVNQLLTASVLEREGFAVEVASSATQATERLRVNKPELILMDIQLPGMDGLALTRLLKADPATAAITIVALTAHAMTGDREQTLAAGCAGYISKPIDTRTFGSQVREFLIKTEPASGPARTDAKLNGT